MRYSAIGFKAEGRKQRAEVGVFHSSENRYNRGFPIQKFCIDQFEYLANFLCPMPFVVVGRRIARVFRILHFILAVVADNLIRMGFYPVPN